ncbi:inorganic pyrophosphatase [Candidatus Phytoplasma luffae]|uniref:Inorganic pyrophosphatase n=1 Tax=Loofah witches'-broom phytoplasma TaxID=35773 RepID=A0A975FJD9_LOWBP|nr:inorganic diphosphatase [Candidatus Phytoplasma luffae]QTX03085.1 inorganic pyrophosphatase [Candidatus Phytoplasma luffae]
MICLDNIDSKRITPNDFIVLIEIPQGSNKKNEIDKETGLLKLDRFLKSSFVYPANYGFIPLTYCDDKDPLDVFVLSQEVLDPFVLVQCRPIGVVKMIDDGELDEKIIAVPIKDSSMQSYQDIINLPTSILEKIKHFLLYYKDLENKSVVIEGIEGKSQAFETIKNALNKYLKLKNN